MIKATKKDKTLIVDILTDSFDNNLSVNYILKSGGNKKNHIKSLMSYSFDMCFKYGDVFLSDNKKACALILYPDKKKSGVYSTFLDFKLIAKAVGIMNIRKVLSRDRQINSKYPSKEIYYLWFIGVSSSDQNQGIGSKLMSDIIKDSKDKSLPIYLETSSNSNIEWYNKFDISVYDVIDFGYKLHFLRNS